MSIDRKAIDRPPARKRFVTAREMRDLADAGIGELVATGDLVITDAARELASDLGIALVPAPAAEVATPRALGAFRPSRDEEVVAAIVEAFRSSGQHSPSEHDVREVTLRVLASRSGPSRGRD